MKKLSSWIKTLQKHFQIQSVTIKIPRAHSLYWLLPILKVVITDAPNLDSWARKGLPFSILLFSIFCKLPQYMETTPLLLNEKNE